MSDETIVPEEQQNAVEAGIQALATENNERLSRLAQQNALPSEAQILKIRLDALTEFVVGGPIRMAFEAFYHNRMSEYLDFVEHSALEADLTRGVTDSVAESIRNLGPQ